jgi:hypothetical protein
MSWEDEKQGKLSTHLRILKIKCWTLNLKDAKDGWGGVERCPKQCIHM